MSDEQLNEKDLDEIIDELEQEVSEEYSEEYSEEDRKTFVKEHESVQMIIQSKKKSVPYWRNLKKLCYYPYRKSPMQRRFQTLAGLTPPCVARLTLPDKTVVEFKELPKWYDVLRYQVSGFKLEIFHIDDLC